MVKFTILSELASVVIRHWHHHNGILINTLVEMIVPSPLKLLLLTLYTGFAVLVGAAIITVLVAVGRFSDILVQYPIAAGVLSDAQPPLPLPSLREIVGDASSDTLALARIVAYFDTHEAAIAQMFRENNPARLRGLFSMYLVHVSSPYGVSDSYDSLLGFIAEPMSHCGTRTAALAQIAQGFGLNTRTPVFELIPHAWAEIEVDGHWELFDATVNVWVDHGADELLNGIHRRYRDFYTPLNDPSSEPDVGNLLLRQRIPGIGLFYIPPTPIA